MRRQAWMWMKERVQRRVGRQVQRKLKTQPRQLMRLVAPTAGLRLSAWQPIPVAAPQKWLVGRFQLLHLFVAPVAV